MRRAALVLLGAAALVAAAGLAWVLHVRHAGRDVRGSSTVEFVAPPAAPTAASSPTPTPTPTTARRTPRAKRAAALASAAWPTYGYDAARTRAAPDGIRPPFRTLWTWHGCALLEFPPAVGYGLVFDETFDGRLYGIDARTGRARWFLPTHRCGWASPALDGGVLFAALIGRRCDEDVPGADGIVLALDARTGRERWRRTIGPVESSPLVVGGTVIVGDWTGRVTALDERTGRTRWTSRVGGAVKGSVAYAGGRVYVGAYDGRLYALRARDGGLVWRASAQPRLGARGTFYSTPAVAYGRVYIGSTDGKVYSFGARSGELRWSHATGGYVYASPAVWNGLVLVGSYDHTFRTFDAATGDERWRFDANGPISGAATVVDGVVYFSTFAGRTYGLDARTGRALWQWPDGKYSPVVAAPGRIYLTGLGRLYALAAP